MTLVRRFARPMLSSMFISGGINALKSAEGHAQAAEPVIDKLHPAIDKATEPLPFDLDSKQLVQLNGVVQVVGGLDARDREVPAAVVARAGGVARADDARRDTGSGRSPTRRSRRSSRSTSSRTSRCSAA